MFGFGKKPKSDSTAAPAAQTPTAQTAPAAAAPPPANNGGGDDMFGGMQARSRRKKTTEAEPEPVVAAAAKAPEPEPPKPEEAKPFFSSFNFAATGAAVDMSAYEDDPETARIRRRLQRFYEKWNPQKLTTLDETIQKFAGRETELFDALEKKYGPEPKDTTKPASKPPARGKSSADDVSLVAPPPPQSDGGFGTDSFGGGSGFGGADAAPATAFGGGDGFGGGFGNDGFGGGDGGFGAAGGFGTGDAAAGFGTTGGFGDGFGGGDFGSGGDGFGFGASDGAATGFGFTAVTDATADGFGFDAPSTGGGGFGFTAEPAAGESAFGFGTTSESNEATQGSVEPASSSGFGFTTAAPVHAPSDHSDSTSDDDDDGRYGQLERQNQLIDAARSSVQSARSAGAAALVKEAEKRRLRRTLVAEYTRLEGELERLTNAEEYEAADLVNTKLGTIAKQIDDLDASKSVDLRRVVLKDVLSALEALSTQYTTQRTVLHETRAEEERRTTNYIAESRTKLEQVADVVRGDLDKATRLLKNTEQEVENLAQRRKKIEDKIAEQTKELRAERDKVSSQATKLEEEIKELEKALAQKRRTLTERKVALQDMDHQLNLVTDAHRESMSSITSQEAEEAARLAEAQRRVAALTHSREANERATADLQEETEAMMQTLEQHAIKIRRFDQNVAVINGTLIQNFASYFEQSIGQLLKARAEGEACLNASPHRADSAGGGQVAALQSKLSSIEAEIKATLDAEGRANARAQELANLLPTLETAKKAAAAAKQFKEAAAKTEEIKRATEERTAVLAEAEALRVKAGALEDNARHVRKEKNAEAAAYRAKIRTFTDGYAQLLRNALVAVDVASASSVAGLEYIDTLPLFDGKGDAAALESDGPQADGADEMIAASRSYVMALFEELAGVLDVPVATLLVDPDEDKAQVEKEASRQTSQSPLNADADAPSAAAFGTEDAAFTAANGDDGFGFGQGGEGFSNEFGNEGNGFGFGTASPPADPFMGLTLDELKAQLTEKKEAQEAAAEREEYELCEQLQAEITLLETAIAEREAFD